ncbi:MAG: DegT/DnrJ/EryC1/StrS aminotransferase family protein [Pseudomonadota bacterium]
MTELAIDGGRPVRDKPFPPWPHFGEDEIGAATRVLKSGKVNYWTGEEGRLFEKEFAASIGCPYGVALANGSVALELALLVLGVGPGDEVVVTPRTFIASASCVAIRGATPIFADVDLDSGNITAESVRAALTPKTSAIICVHLAGWPCDMESIMDLAKEKELWVIEDCAQALGAKYKGRPVGSFGHVSCFSFCQDKMLTTGGEGGMLITNDEALFKRVWSYKDHGKSYDTVYDRKAASDSPYVHESIGTNLRLTEIQAAIGRVALRKLTDWVKIRRRNAEMLEQGFKKYPSLRVAVPAEVIYNSYYRCCSYVRPERLKPSWDRDRITAAINAEGIPCFSWNCSEVYLERAFTDCSRELRVKSSELELSTEKSGVRSQERLPSAKELGETSLLFLVHPTLTEEDMKDAVKAMDKVMSVAAR